MTQMHDEPLYPYSRSTDQDARNPVRHRIAIVGAGPVGLAAGIDLAMKNIPVVILDENDRVSHGSRAICFSKRTLEIADRLGLGQTLLDKGVQWNAGKVFFRDRKVYDFNLLPEAGHSRPAFINLQQYHLEHALVERIRSLQGDGLPIDLRGGGKVEAVRPGETETAIDISTPDGPYSIAADWIIACDGATSGLRDMLGLGFTGRVFEDNFLIADVTMEVEFPTERWFWFDPPFNPGQSALLHKQPDGVWRIDLQLGWNIDRKAEVEPERVRARVSQMLGADVRFELEWVSIYTFQCRRMDRFRHGRIVFAGDSAHQVSPFGARGANSGIQDVDNLCWKLAAIINGEAPESLLDSYDRERIQAADENILNSTRSTDFITPKSDMSRIFRNAVLDLSERHSFARPFVNSGRLSLPSTYDGSTLNSADLLEGGPYSSRPGAPCPDAPFNDGHLLDHLGGRFSLLAIGREAPTSANLPIIASKSDISPEMRERYLGKARSAVYLIRPDQHVAARWSFATAEDVRSARERATGKTP
ncbi:MAG: FAD-dependent oxidoreductase [Roseovarius sp.]|nr:FAD-dependent oxidoreductase [Roseovarius sp.]MCY4292859.1 FAD-dependent oxidoreductase [Roseovarius sp.]